MKTIDKFQGEHRFLSNFWTCFVSYGGLMFGSVEHGYVFAKYQGPGTIDLITKLGKATAAEAKRIGRKIELRPDWENIKLDVMEDLVRDKFTRNLEERQMLLNTGSARLIEGNHWGDTFWGVCKGQGENHLGRILMKVRAELSQ